MGHQVWFVSSSSHQHLLSIRVRTTRCEEDSSGTAFLYSLRRPNRTPGRLQSLLNHIRCFCFVSFSWRHNNECEIQTFRTRLFTHNSLSLTTFHPPPKMLFNPVSYTMAAPPFQSYPMPPSVLLRLWSIPQAAILDPSRKQHQSEGLASWCFSIIQHNDKDILSATFVPQPI